MWGQNLFDFTSVGRDCFINPKFNLFQILLKLFEMRFCLFSYREWKNLFHCLYFLQSCWLIDRRSFHMDPLQTLLSVFHDETMNSRGLNGANLSFLSALHSGLSLQSQLETFRSKNFSGMTRSRESSSYTDPFLFNSSVLIVSWFIFFIVAITILFSELVIGSLA